MSLHDYKRKRDFTITSEPSGGGSKTDKKRQRFVIQKHDATRLHFDFRLEMGGTLVSWAVPKGMPMVKGEKRLAIKVEDHPVSYIDFEGVIPKGQYGGGTVQVWDYGTYEPQSKAPVKELRGGKLHFSLQGGKLSGEWYLVRLKEDNQWLVIRGGEDHPKLGKAKAEASALSGKSMAQLEKVEKQEKAPAASTAEFVEPMKARMVERVPTGDWLFEVKFDGFRALAYKEAEAVQLLSRTNHDLTGKFSEIAEAMKELKAHDAIMDGEIVALDAKGRSSFQTILKVLDSEVPVSNLGKVFYPRTGFTKGQVIDYYARIGPVLLPHLHGRPVSLKRYPDGVDGIFFYEKQCPSHAPSWLKTVKVGKTNGGHIDYCVINDLPSLVWAANIANFELHTFQHRAPALQQPTALVFDLDPGPPASIIGCCEVAMRIKGMFDALGLESFPKTSGSKGMQLVVPLNTPVTYAQTKAFARQVADTLTEMLPDLVVVDMKTSLRKGKVFIDWSQNDDKKTTVSVYSLRAKDTPSVSTPVKWSEVTAALKQKAKGVLEFESDAVLKRVKKWGDLFAPVLTLKQKLPTATGPR